MTPTPDFLPQASAAPVHQLFEVEELEQRLENEGWGIHPGDDGGVVIDSPV